MTNSFTKASVWVHSYSISHSLVFKFELQIERTREYHYRDACFADPISSHSGETGAAMRFYMSAGHATQSDPHEIEYSYTPKMHLAVYTMV